MSAEDLEIVELQSKVRTLTAEVERLRGALRECAKHVGAAVSEDATTDFHCMIADGVGAWVKLHGGSHE